MIYWNGYDDSFQWMYMNEPSKSLYFRSGFFSIILFAAATLLFLTKEGLFGIIIIFTHLFFIPTHNYFYPSF